MQFEISTTVLIALIVDKLTKVNLKYYNNYRIIDEQKTILSKMTSMTANIKSLTDMSLKESHTLLRVYKRLHIEFQKTITSI